MPPRRLAPLAFLSLLGTPALGQLSPPTVQSTRPPAASPGEPFAVEIKGTDLDGATRLQFDAPGVRVDAFEPSKTSIKAKVTLPADAPPGPLLFRVVGPRGTSNAGQVFVGRALKTVAEVEPNNGFRRPMAVAGAAVAVDGKIEPGNEVDVYAIDLKAGETLAAEVIAARAGSGLDALITVFGPNLREAAEDDDTFGRDAAVSLRAKVSGRYFVQVQDADGQNRDGKIEATKVRPYRLELGAIAPATTAPPRSGEVDEVEPNDTDEAPQAVTVPASIHGRLGGSQHRGEADVDVYRLAVAPGQAGTYRVSALASRLGSPADPVLTVLDEKGEAQAENDDTGGRDARLERTIDAKGLLVAVRDYYGRGGPRFVYRLEIERVPDRSVTVTADLGARVVPRGGSVALPVVVERRGYDGPVTVLAGETPEGVSAVPLTIPRGATAGLLLVSATDAAPAGLFPFRVTTRDAGAPAGCLYRERSAVGPEPPQGWLFVADPAALGVRIEPGEVAVAPGSSATVKVVLDRRGEAAKKAAVKVKLVAAAGTLDGFDPVSEATLAAGSDSATFTLKARPDAPPSRRTFAAIARLDGSAEWAAVASGAALAVGGK